MKLGSSSMRITIFGMVMSLLLIAAVACSGHSDAPSQDTAPPTSTPPAARATQPAIAPDLKDSQYNEPVAGSGGPQQGGIFNTLWSDPPTLDPHLVTDGTSYGIVIEVFSGLVRLGTNPSNPFEPDLAESWQVLEDGTVYEFKLRNDLKFSNGDPVTAQDFKWSLERAAHPDTSSTVAEEFLGDIVGIHDIVEGNATNAEGIEVVDERTLRLTIDAPKAYFIAKLTYPTAFVLNRNNLESMGRDWVDE
ncbi:MAG TPA: hypothetical protein DHV68_03530, partial [Dehalococcoidia bacterium]|nr:hypothetical protein [Dehalococcoidia bacterium]